MKHNLIVREPELYFDSIHQELDNFLRDTFLATSFGSSSTYGKNQPVAGGYFAGYYNGVPNIVGRKLFIEI